MSEIMENEVEQFDGPAKIEKISLTEISQEKISESKEKTDALVKKIMDKVLEIK